MQRLFDSIFLEHSFQRRRLNRTIRLIVFSGGEYIASHNETSINISSSLLPKVSVCAYGNHTYSVGEKIVRDCEDRCVCLEGGVMDCQPLCVPPYIRAGRGIEDPLCQEKLAVEEPCCALVLCAADSGILSFFLASSEINDFGH